MHERCPYGLVDRQGLINIPRASRGHGGGTEQTGRELTIYSEKQGGALYDGTTWQSQGNS
jgi:hypothetical protein